MICVPYPKLHWLKTIPFTTAQIHIYLAYRWEYLSPWKKFLFTLIACKTRRGNVTLRLNPSSVWDLFATHEKPVFSRPMKVWDRYWTALAMFKVFNWHTKIFLILFAVLHFIMLLKAGTKIGRRSEAIKVFFSREAIFLRLACVKPRGSAGTF